MSGETAKMFLVRQARGDYDRYLHGHGIDIGCGGDLLQISEGTVDPWDKEQGDAHGMGEIAQETYDFVYCAAGGQRVCTPDGWIPIEKISPGDIVLGRSGFTKVYRTLKMDYVGRDIVALKTSQGIVKVTANHGIATPSGWLKADHFREPGHAVCCSTKVQASQLVDRIKVKLTEASFPSLGSGFSIPVAYRHAPFAKINHDLGLPMLSEEKRLDGFQQVQNARVSADDGRSARRLTRIIRDPQFNAKPSGAKIANNLFAFAQNNRVAIDDLDTRLNYSSSANVKPNRSLSIYNSSKPSYLFFDNVSFHSFVRSDYVYHLETQDNTFFVEGVLSHNSSHCLEHLEDPLQALERWIEILKPGGFLYVVVPDYDLYEHCQWPSKFNSDHKWTFGLWRQYADEHSKHLNVPILAMHYAWLMKLQEMRLEDYDYDYSLGPEIDQTGGGAVAQICWVSQKL